MPRGNPAPKLTVTIDPEVHRGIMAAAEDEGLSVSAWVTDAARQALKIREGLAAVAEWEAENGAPTEAELAEADRRIAEMLAASRNRRRAS